MTIPWGDVATACAQHRHPRHRGVHGRADPGAGGHAAQPVRGSLLSTKWVQDRIKARIRSGPPGPTDEQRARGKSLLWGEASDDAGGRVVSRLATPEGYTLTADAALAIVKRVLGGDAPVGFQTPAKAYGADFVLGLEGVTRTDEV